MKLQISLNDELLKRVDDFAEKNYMTRSGLISFVLTKYLNESEYLLAVKDLSMTLRKIADTGEVDQATLNQLEDFERFVSVMTK